MHDYIYIHVYIPAYLHAYIHTHDIVIVFSSISFVVFSVAGNSLSTYICAKQHTAWRSVAETHFLLTFVQNNTQHGVQ